MMYLVMLLTAVVVGLVIGQMDSSKPKHKEWKPKKKGHSHHNNDDFWDYAWS